MPWTLVRVRAATPLDLPALLAFGDELREQVMPSETGRARVSADRSGLEERYLEAIADPARHLVLAVDGKEGEPEEPLGMALFTVASANALLDIPAVHMSHAVVSDRHRRRGAGKALVAAATVFAEEQGVDQLVVSVHPQSREANRFFARLGFVPLAVRRTAPVTVVRRQLALGERSIEHVVRRRPSRAGRAARVGTTAPLQRPPVPGDDPARRP